MTKTSSNALGTLSWCNLAAQSAEQISLAAVPIVAVMLLQAGPGEMQTMFTLLEAARQTDTASPGRSTALLFVTLPGSVTCAESKVPGGPTCTSVTQRSRGV